jgi:hypothetical protein
MSFGDVILYATHRLDIITQIIVRRDACCFVPSLSFHHADTTAHKSVFHAALRFRFFFLSSSSRMQRWHLPGSRSLC